MAVRASRRGNLEKRSAYVSPEFDYGSSTSDAYSSENESSYCASDLKKLSVKSLMRNSRTYKKSDEHGYTQPALHKKSNNSTDIRRKRCESKNAINARINRERKKAYVVELESEIEKLRETSKTNAQKVLVQEDTIKSLTQEVSQLKSLLANNKYLGALVSKLSDVTGLPVTSSLLAHQDNRNAQPRIRSVPSGLNHPIARSDVNLNVGRADDLFLSSEISDETMFPTVDCSEMNDFNPFECLPFECSEPALDYDRHVGLCVHINQNRLSVEFCSVCNSKAR